MIHFTPWVCERIFNSFLSLVRVSTINCIFCLLKLFMKCGSVTDVDCQSSMKWCASKLNCGGLKNFLDFNYVPWFFIIFLIYYILLCFRIHFNYVSWVLIIFSIYYILMCFRKSNNIPKRRCSGCAIKAFIWSVDWAAYLRFFSKYLMHCTIFKMPWDA